MADGTAHRVVPEDVLLALIAMTSNQALLESAESFTIRMRSLRAARNISQGDLAKEVGITQSKLSRIESGLMDAPAALQAHIISKLLTG